MAEGDRAQVWSDESYLDVHGIGDALSCLTESVLHTSTYPQLMCCLVLLNALFSIASPVLLREVLQFMASRQSLNPEPLSYGYGLAIAYGIVGLGLVFSNSGMATCLSRSGLKLK